MDAQVAFAFVLNSEATKKSVDSRYLAQETQVCCHLVNGILGALIYRRLLCCIFVPIGCGLCMAVKLDNMCLTPHSRLLFTSLYSVMQVTRSLLCNLLDVVEEVDLARSEIYNLIQTSFQTPSGNKYVLIMNDSQFVYLNFPHHSLN